MKIYKILLTTIVFFLVTLSCKAIEFNPLTRNMANTVSPIINKLSEVACGYKNVQLSTEDGWVKGGNLIYKREKRIPNDSGESCVTGKGNVYYIRCYNWKYDNKKRLIIKPTKDVPLNVFSCIPESEIEIPYWDKRLQNAPVGKEYIEK